VCVTPTLIAFAQGNDLRLVAANDGAARGELKGHTKSVRALAATADGQRLASVALDNTLRLWDVAQQKQLRELKLDATPRCVAFAPDGQLVAVGTVAGNIHLFAVATGKPGAVLTGHTYSVRTLAFAPDGQQLLSGSDDLKAVLWEVPSGKRLRTLTGHSSLVTGVAFTADGKQAVTGAQDGTVRLWNVATGKALRRLVDGQPGFTALALNGTTLIVGGQGADVLVLDVKP
jgi:WD40 repeat protein